jgi:hypothetical protein
MKNVIFPTPQWIEGLDSARLPMDPPRIKVLLNDPAAQKWIADNRIPLLDEIHRPGGYLLDIRPEGILLAGYDAAGCFYAEQSLRQMAEDDGLAYVSIQDWPYKSLRGIHLFMPGREDIPFFKKLLNWLATLKYNTVFLEVGGGMRYHKHPEINTAWEKFCREAEAFPGGPDALMVEGTRFIKDSPHTELGGGSFLEQDEVRGLVEYARSLHLEILPEVQALSHAYYLCCAYPEIAELPADPWPDTFCPSNPLSYEIYFDVLSEVIEVFQPRLVHVGHDEVRTLGVCPRCQGKSGNDLLGDNLLKIYHFLKERGIRMAMWGDTLLPFSFNMWEGGTARRMVRHNGNFADVPETFRAIEKLPRDILISEWQGNTNPLPMEFFIKEGFEVYCGNFGDNFFAHNYTRWDERSVSPQVLGGEVSTWCAVSEFAFAYNGCLFNMAFSAELLWWSHYRDAERGRLTAQLAGVLAKTRRQLGRDATTGTEICASISLATPVFHPVFAPHISGHLLDSDHPEVSISVNASGLGLVFTHLCQTVQHRKPTWELSDLYRHPDENRLVCYRVRYQDGNLVEFVFHYGTHLSRWDVPYGEHVDAIPYAAEPLSMRQAATGERITAYRTTWSNPHPEKVILSVDAAFLGESPAALWLTDLALMQESKQSKNKS